MKRKGNHKGTKTPRRQDQAEPGNEGNIRVHSCSFVVALAIVFWVSLWWTVSSLAWTGMCLHVADGDTIAVDREGERVPVRLWGIDCPEKNQPCGLEAKRFTEQACLQKLVVVEPLGADRYGRTIAEVTCGGKCLNTWLVMEGLAWWYRKYAPQDIGLKHMEAFARVQKRGIWADPDPVPPWEWRQRGKRIPARRPAPPKNSSVPASLPGVNAEGK